MKTKEKGVVAEKFLKKCSKDFLADPKNLLARNAVSHVDLGEIAMDRDVYNQVNHTFSHQVKLEGKATNQRQTGRCWLFAALNTMRLPLMEKYQLEDFEFSQAYLFFWDKFEKANFFLENVITTVKEDAASRLLMWLTSKPIEDGGQWHMFVNLVKKYGVVPKDVMPEIFSSKNSVKINALLNAKLREFAIQLRAMHGKGQKATTLRKEKESMLEEIYKILAIFLGEPPVSFEWHFRNKKKKYKHFTGLTPQTFFKKHVPYKLDDKICLINAPTKNKPFNKLFTVNFLGNVTGGDIIKYINLPIENLRRFTMASLKGGESVWFGADVGKCFHRKLGVMDDQLYNYELVFGTDSNMTKAERLDYGESQMTHAMVFTAVDIKNKKPVKWRVENSWGKDSGDKGYFLMTDKWFDEFVYEVIVDKKYIPKNVLSILKQKPIVLDPWDPMGSLA